MATFSLKIVTPDGLAFDGQADSLSVRLTSGDIGILAGHTDFVSALGMGMAKIVTEGQTRTAACIGGMLSVICGNVTLVPTTFEWADKIDIDRAKHAKEAAEQKLAQAQKDDETFRHAEAKLKRALVRLSVAESLK